MDLLNLKKKIIGFGVGYAEDDIGAQFLVDDHLEITDQSASTLHMPFL